MIHTYIYVPDYHKLVTPLVAVNIYTILYGHVVGMVRCDWSFTVGYIIKSFTVYTSSW